jgi:hypothetical protein
MNLVGVEVLDEGASKRLRRDARHARRKRRRYLLRANPVELLWRGISEFQSRSDFQNMEAPESPLPPVADHLVGRFEKHTDIALLFFAREKACPVLVQFSAGPSKAAEARLRQAAKSRSLKLRFFRLIEGLISRFA